MSAASTRRTLWLHDLTDRALLVSTENSHQTADDHGTGGWLPLSEIAVIRRAIVRNPGFGKEARIAEFMGTAVLADIPDWLLADRGITKDAAVPACWIEGD